MTDERPSVYRVERDLRIGGGERISGGDLLVNPPTWAVDQLDRNLTRLDNGTGRLPRDVLGHLTYDRLRTLAAEGDIEGVNGNSSPEDIIEAYAADQDEDEDVEEA